MESLSVYEKMDAYGVDYVGEIELISTLTGAKKESIRDLVDEFGSITRACLNVSLSDIKFTKRQKQKIQLIGELFKRNTSQEKDAKIRINNPDIVADLYMSEMRYLNIEHFDVIILNTKNEVIKKVNVSKGILNASIVHPREVFREAIKYNANSIMILHNHPSGDPTESQEDINITHRLVDAGKLIGITVLDHIIIGDGRFVSLREKNLM